LCLRGYVVICPDRFPFESRSLARTRVKEQFDEFRIFTEHGLELTEDLYAGCVANRLLFEEGQGAKESLVKVSPGTRSARGRSCAYRRLSVPLTA
jgi:hypothetical protein